jgi:pyruvate/2-oxoglutarate dehydrogenase complex dihydrolipoamide acyltransferase (E2) component
MTIEVIMPQLGESVIEGTVAKWLIAAGQPVEQSEPLLQITTDKVDTELPAPASGILLEILVEEGQTVPKGTVLAVIGTEDGGRQTTDDRRPAGGGHSATPLAQRMAAEHGIDLTAVTSTGPDGRITREDVEAYLATAAGTGPTPSLLASSFPASSLGFISPVVGRLAAELGVDLAQIIGTGAGGRITKKDVLAYVAAPTPRESLPVTESRVPGHLASEAPKPTDSQIISLSPMRLAIARHMTLSAQTAPQVTTVMEADMTHVVAARERLRGESERQGVKLTFTPFFIQAIVAGLKAVPEANSSFRDDALLVHRRIHIGVAVALSDGLIVPVIRDADEKSLLGLARAVNDLAERARSQRLAPDDVQGGTFTLTNHGTSGSLLATPIIVQPQAGILGIGAIQKRPVVVTRGGSLLPDAGDAIAIRPMVYLSFTFDHRVLDGAAADRFLAAVKRFLEEFQQ